jgi:hypothetical protein
MGAGLGVAIGAAHGKPAAGAAIGAGSGLTALLRQADQHTQQVMKLSGAMTMPTSNACMQKATRSPHPWPPRPGRHPSNRVGYPLPLHRATSHNTKRFMVQGSRQKIKNDTRRRAQGPRRNMDPV